MKSPIASLFLALLLPVSVFAENTYLSSGVAASDRAWTGSDYTSFFALLKDGKIPLPRLADEQGNAVMMRICSIDNLAFSRNQNLPLSIRMGDYLSIQESIAGLFNIYLKKAAEGEKVGGEVTTPSQPPGSGPLSQKVSVLIHSWLSDKASCGAQT